MVGAMVALVALTGSAMAAAPTSTPQPSTSGTTPAPPTRVPRRCSSTRPGRSSGGTCPATTTWYKDVYRFQDFEGATHWGHVSTLNSPVNNLMLKTSRQPGHVVLAGSHGLVPNLGKPTRIYTLRDYRTMTTAEHDRFYAATETITGGYIIADPYAPAINVTATGVAGTTGYIGYIETGTGSWHGLGTVDGQR